MVGEVDSSDPNQVLIFTHKRFEIGYNGEQIVDVNMTADNKVILKPNEEVTFTYEVIWKPSAIVFDDRFDKYLDPTFFQHRVRYRFIGLNLYCCIFRFTGSLYSIHL